MAVVGVVECVWDPQSPFRGWQEPAAGEGVTPYYRHLSQVAGYGAEQASAVDGGAAVRGRGTSR
jgi:hypothetical protein